jgi:tyrosine-protein phosphatase YwqE
LVFAHPERCETFHREKNIFGKLVAMDCHFPTNIGSFAGLYGDTARRPIASIPEAGAYDRIGTNAHWVIKFDRCLKNGQTRRPGFRSGLDRFAL